MHGLVQTINMDLAVSVHEEGKTYLVSGCGLQWNHSIVDSFEDLV